MPKEDQPLPPSDFETHWDDVTSADVDELERVLDASKGERELQKFFERHPNLLVQHLGGGHGRWVVPQKRLGAEFVPDFVVGELSSIGYHWELVELESPRNRMFLKNGDYSAATNHGVGQVKRWRAWLTANARYARAARDDNGLGLTGIRSNLDGVVLIGRRGVGGEEAGLRADDLENSRIAIHSYDWLVERARARIKALRGPGRRTVVVPTKRGLTMRQVYLKADRTIRELKPEERPPPRKLGSAAEASSTTRRHLRK